MIQRRVVLGQMMMMMMNFLVIENHDVHDLRSILKILCRFWKLHSLIFAIIERIFMTVGMFSIMYDACEICISEGVLIIKMQNE